MVYNRYYSGIWIRVMVLAAVIFLFVWFLLNTHRYYTLFFLGCVIVAQIFEMVHYQNKINQYLSRFLIHLREQNLSFRYDPGNASQTFKDLTDILAGIQTMVFKANLEKEKQFHYLNYVVSYLDVGVITLYPSGKIELINPAALKILGVLHISHISELDKVSTGLPTFIASLKGGQQQLYKINWGNSVGNLSFRCGEFRIEQVAMKLVSFQDIHAELEEQELGAWQKLIRVLTHEIMNSVTPVNTLVQSLIRQFRKSDAKEMNSQMISEMVDGLEMIEERGEAILEFVNKFRSLTKLPQPHFKIQEIDVIVGKVFKLFHQDFISNDVQAKCISPDESLTIIADERLLFQSLINIIKNALEALEETKEKTIAITIGTNEFHRNYISIADNGCGIDPGDLEKIFVPFFTTKESGSGIGLSFAREVMRLHKGSLVVKSEKATGTTVDLIF